MDIFDIVIANYIKSFDFKGKCDRQTYWWFYLSIVILQILISFLMIFLPGLVNALLTLFLVFSMIPFLSITTRRLHDVGRSGWWQLLYLTGIGSFVVLYWTLLPSKN